MNASKTLSSLGSVLASAPLETRKIARRAAAAATYGAARPTTSTGPSLLHAGERDPDQQNVLGDLQGDLQCLALLLRLRTPGGAPASSQGAPAG